MNKKINLMTTSPMEVENNGLLSPADQKIWQALTHRNLAGRCFTPNEVNVIFTNNGYQLLVKNEPVEISALLVRLTRGAPERSYEIASAFESLGGRVSDPVQNLIYPGSKLTPYQNRVGNVNFVPTYFFNKNHADINHIQSIIPYPLILKPQTGFYGQGVALIHDEQEFKDYLGTTQEENLMAQEYISDITDEFRVVVVGGKGLGVVRKVGEGIAKNAAQGSISEAVVDDEVLAFAEHAAKFGPADVYGADVVRTSSGQLYLIENNRAPNFLAFNEATGISVENSIIDFIVEKF
ncbi:MAG: RimK family alpha-L-glutamate ligase [Candidatus Paceibacteria bacterium]